MRKEELAFSKGYRISESGEIINPKGLVLNGNINNNYKGFGIRWYGKVSYCLVHRLHAFQKYGEKLFEEGIVVRHLNGNSLDNSYENLVIGTYQQNSLDVPASVRMSAALHATSFVRKYDKEEVRDWHISNGSSYKNTMEHFDISSKGTLHFILNK